MTKSYSRWKEFLAHKAQEVECEDKTNARIQVAEDVEAFLASGGVIHECEPGETADPDTSAFRKGVMRNV